MLALTLDFFINKSYQKKKSTSRKQGRNQVVPYIIKSFKTTEQKRKEVQEISWAQIIRTL